MRRQKTNPRIVLVQGQWYAFAPNRSRASMQMLVPAIIFCKRLNTKRSKA